MGKFSINRFFISTPMKNLFTLFIFSCACHASASEVTLNLKIYTTVISKDLNFLNTTYDDNFAVADVLLLMECKSLSLKLPISLNNDTCNNSVLPRHQ